MDADELAGKLGLRLDGGVNSVGLAYKIRIECTDDDASVVRVQSMQIDEVLAIKSQQGSSASRGRSKYLFVRHRLPGLASFVASQHVMPQPTEFHDYR